MVIRAGHEALWRHRQLTMRYACIVGLRASSIENDASTIQESGWKAYEENV